MPDLTPSKAFDAESGELVAVSPEMRQRAIQMHGVVDLSTRYKALALTTIADEKLYLALGAGSFKEYCEIAGVGYRSALMYIEVGRATGQLYPGVTVNPSRLLGQGNGEDVGEEVQPLHSDPSENGADRLFDLGVSKLSMLAKIDAGDLRALAETEKPISLPSGKEVTYTELQEMTRAELAKEMRKETRQLREKAAALDERAKLADSERQATEAELKRTKQQLHDAELELRSYGPRAANVGEKRRALDHARAAIDTARRAIVKADIKHEDPEELKLTLAQVIQYLSRAETDMKMIAFESIDMDDLPDW